MKKKRGTIFVIAIITLKRWYRDNNIFIVWDVNELYCDFEWLDDLVYLLVVAYRYLLECYVIEDCYRSLVNSFTVVILKCFNIWSVFILGCLLDLYSCTGAKGSRRGEGFWQALWLASPCLSSTSSHRCVICVYIYLIMFTACRKGWGRWVGAVHRRSGYPCDSNSKSWIAPAKFIPSITIIIIQRQCDYG